MVDRVVDIEPGISGVGLKNVTITDPVFSGHFPEFAIYPGVLLIESAGHVSGIVEMAGQLDEGSQSIGILAGIHKFAFKNPVVPGDQVRICVKRKVGAGALFEYDCLLTAGERVVATGSIAIAKQSVGRKAR